MRSLLHDYLATDGNNALYTHGDSTNLSLNIFAKNPRDKQKVLVASDLAQIRTNSGSVFSN